MKFWDRLFRRYEIPYTSGSTLEEAKQAHERSEHDNEKIAEKAIEASQIIRETRRARLENNFAARMHDAFRGQT